LGHNILRVAALFENGSRRWRRRRRRLRLQREGVADGVGGANACRPIAHTTFLVHTLI